MPTRAMEDLQDFTAYYCSVLCFRCPRLTTEYSVVIPVYEAILTLIVLASFANASFKDPGIIPRGRAPTTLLLDVLNFFLIKLTSCG